MQELTYSKYIQAEILIKSADAIDIHECFAREITLYYNQDGQLFTENGHHIADIIINN